MGKGVRHPASIGGTGAAVSSNASASIPSKLTAHLALAVAAPRGIINSARARYPFKLWILVVVFLYAVFQHLSRGLERSAKVFVGNSWIGEWHTWILRGMSKFWGVTLNRGFERIGNWPDDKQVFIGIHPHGAVTWIAYLMGSSMITNVAKPTSPPKEDDWHQPLTRQAFCGIAQVLFRIPVLRESLLLCNARLADTKVMTACLDAGHSAVLEKYFLNAVVNNIIA